jgi:hypothetical protein
MPSTRRRLKATAVAGHCAGIRSRAGAYHSDTLSVTLPPGRGAEIKAPMRAGATNGEYTSYWIERSQREAPGIFTATFDGDHGWYRLNRGSEPVTMQLEVTGLQGNLFRPGHQ